MKVTITTRSLDTLEQTDYRDMVRIEIDGQKVFEVEDGEPEDSNLSRAFADCYTIDKLLKMAYDAGFRREQFEVESIEE
jgi:hypothetical protein